MKRKTNKMSAHKNYDEWVVATLKNNSKQADHFLKISLENFEKDGDIPSLLLALRQVAQVKGGMTKLADQTKLTREALYKILSKDGNPTITTLKIILDALGYAFSLKFARIS